MATRLDRASGAIRLHQALHGYADGHRLIASSATNIDRHDAKRMLVLSDAAGRSKRALDDGYLTGYPLLESGFFALSKTWSAPEMPRPGCVWTHTLLIDFSDLGTLTAPEALLPLFCRPSGEAFRFSRYEQALEHECAPLAELDSSHDEAVVFLVPVISDLYGKPAAAVKFDTFFGRKHEQLVLRIWGQQWPKLKRSFRFSTYSTSERSPDSSQFDLQFVESRSREKADHSIGNYLSVMRDSPWLQIAVVDAIKPFPGFREYLLATGADVSSGRAGYAPLAGIFSFVFGPKSKEEHGLDSAIVIAQENFRGEEGLNAKGFLTIIALQRPDEINANSFAFVLDHLAEIDPAFVQRYGDEFGRQLWLAAGGVAANALTSHGIGPDLALSSLKNLSLEDAYEAFKRLGVDRRVVLVHRTDLLELPEFWRESSIDDQTAALVLAREAELNWREILRAMMAANAFDRALEVRKMAGTQVFLDLVVDLYHEHPLKSLENRWLRAAVEDADAVAHLLASRPGSLNERILADIADCMQPATIPNAYGDDPWIVALGATTPPFRRVSDVTLSAFLFARALERRSRSQGELMAVSLDALYAAAESDALPPQVRRMLDWLLPEASFWFEWDFCERLRMGVCNAFVDRRLSQAIFMDITDNEPLFRALVSNISQSYSGRSFLKGALNVRNLDAKTLHSRRRIIDQVL